MRLETEERNVRAEQEAEECGNSVPVHNNLASLADLMMFDCDANGNWQEAHIGSIMTTGRPTGYFLSISPRGS